jgi:hypothetical protein
MGCSLRDFERGPDQQHDVKIAIFVRACSGPEDGVGFHRGKFERGFHPLQLLTAQVPH